MDPQHPAPGPSVPAEGPFPLSGVESTRVILTRPGQRPGSLPVELAQLLLTRYTRAGDIVVDLDDDVALAAEAAASGRRHYPAGDRGPAGVADAAGCAQLVLLSWPRPPTDPRLLLEACRDLLGPSGRLALAVRVGPPMRAAHLVALVGAARTAGLRLVGHLIARTAPDALTPAAGDERRQPGEEQRDQSWPSSVTTAPDTDLLILQPEVGGHD
jgi:hypothetical protein